MKRLILRMVAGLGVASLLASCATAYDAQGRPVQVVTPEGAAATALVAGLIGYALADDKGSKHRRHHGYHHGHGGYYGGGHYGGGYCR